MSGIFGDIMSRRRSAQERKILPDPKYKSNVVAKFINGMMLDGKRSIVEHIFYDAMAIIEKRTKEDPLVVFNQAMENTAPILEVKSRRVGGATYQVPIEVREKRRKTLSIRWLVMYSRQRSEKTMAEKPGLYKNFYEIGCGDGQVVNYLSTRLKPIDQFVGIDINERVILSNGMEYKNPKLHFVCANANDWIAHNSCPGSIFFTNGGVLEYFTERELIGLFSKIAVELRPSLFAIVEPFAHDFDLESEKASRPFGVEWSFSHNYPQLFTTSGLTIRYQAINITGGIRWIIMIAQTNC